MKHPYLIDECLGKPMADILGACAKDFDFKLLTTYFPYSMKDLDWLPQIAEMRPQPVILSSDFKMSKRKLEIYAFRQYSLTAVLMMGFENALHKMVFRERVWRILRGWPQIEKALDVPHPVIVGFHIYSGQITIL